jgi:hypothetical protein
MMSVSGLTCHGNVHDWYDRRELSVFMIGTIRGSFQPVPGVQQVWKDYYDARYILDQLFPLCHDGCANLLEETLISGGS